MARIVVIGGGLAGCLIANEVASRGMEVTIIEKSDDIGGKVKNYGCKATDTCNNCGLCLVKNLWDNIKNNEKIEILTHSRLIDIDGKKGDYKVIVKVKDNTRILERTDKIVVAIGFDNFSSISWSNLEFNSNSNIISGYQLEKIISHRGKKELFSGLLSGKPESIAFIQCFGSRDIKEKAMYCSRVCCGYSTRAAKVIRQYYPEAEITFFYMDLQWVEGRGYFESLKNEKIEFIGCRPIKIKSGIPGITPAKIVYEDPKLSKLIEREYDIIILSEGIHPAEDAGHIAEICGLEQDENGFLRYVVRPETTGIYIAGCAGGPKRIEEVYAQSLAVAKELAFRGEKLEVRGERVEVRS
ncbi:MAG: CoB--CoM heterodisulfide reductase iron-sulfur subunit A family protein [Firmicutes bacterium]|nr:CoB--CoM heterodisulfide reductase iron-sulfur subunit A family protein [Bacillota bacterium]